ncbi:MAG: hypothetical protein IT424_07370 [Pirellulales bacterium]|nr:hypothetical protein [Pirellulales bacterium]
MRRFPNMANHARRLPAAVLIASGLLAGCSRGPNVAPVSGKVLYNGEPLPYGNVVFQPPQGQPAGGAIQPDGTFRLSTFEEYDGAIVGPHKVSVSCYSSQNPAHQFAKTVGEATLGALMIPEQYAFLDQSGLTAEVPAGGTDSIVLQLKGPPQTFLE